MSRTYKKKAAGYFRSLSGHKQAVINKARKRAIPPDSWEDIHYDRQCDLPYKVSLALHKKGWENDRIKKHLRKKFKIESYITDDYISYGAWYGCKCQSCMNRRYYQKNNKKGILELYEENPYEEESNIVKPWR